LIMRRGFHRDWSEKSISDFEPGHTAKKRRTARTMPVANAIFESTVSALCSRPES
jgi:hypothetical protein